MKIRCINNNRSRDEITISKSYDVLYVLNDCYRIVNDKGEEGNYAFRRFVVVSYSAVEFRTTVKSMVLSGLSKEELITIFSYCYNMSRCISSMSIPVHDGSMSDMFDQMVTQLSNGSVIDIQNDDFYRNVYDRMKGMVEWWIR